MAADVLLDGLGPHERAGIGTFRLPGHDPATVHRTLEAAGLITTRRDEWIRLSPHTSTPGAAADLLAEVLHSFTRPTSHSESQSQEPICPTN